MNDIKTRPKTRDIQVRDAAALAPKELSKLMKDSTTAKLRSRDTAQYDTADSAAVRCAIGEFEGDAKGATAYGSSKAYQAGKILTQKRYDEQFRADKSKSTKQADRSSETGQPADFSGVGGALVPFVNQFPTNTALYRLMTTKLSEKIS